MINMSVIKSIKIMLLPNNKQSTKLFQSAGVGRWAYNWTLAKQQENYKNGRKFISDNDLRKELTQLKKTDEFNWINGYSCDIPKQSIKDACLAYQRFFKHQSDFPKFKSKRKSTPSFYQDNFKIQFTENKVYLSSIGLIKLAEKNKFPIGKGKNKEIKVINPRITFDGINWWISAGVDYEENTEQPINNGIGIDIGIKDLAICSNGNTYKNINKTKQIKKLKTKKRRLQRKVSKKYLKNKKGCSYCKTCNIIKSEKQLLKLNHRLTNIRHNYLNQVTSEIVNRKPKFIVLEDLNVKGMMKNRHLAKAVQEQCFYEFYRQIQYKCLWNNIKFITADRYFPSSKLCSVCGNIKKDLKLSDRTYICECGNIIDRDYQASVNLYNYGKLIT